MFNFSDMVLAPIVVVIMVAVVVGAVFLFFLVAGFLTKKR